MKLGSLFDGSGGFPLAATMSGITPVWASEVEPYPIAVTRSRFPKMKHLGDISRVNGAEIEPVDIITFGSPCQDMSVAGKREGIKHSEHGDEETTRSGLFYEAIRIIKEMRENDKASGRTGVDVRPRFIIWENVAGAFSSNGGEDFRLVLEEIIKIAEPSAVMPCVPKGGWAYADSYRGDGWSVSYRVFDAQYWGVPQRRRRIYLVADFGSERAEEILFKRDGLQGYFAESRTPWQGTPEYVERSTLADDRDVTGFDRYNQCITGGVSATLRAPDGGDNCACVIEQAVCFGISPYESNAMKSSNPNSGIYVADTSRTLDLNGGNPACNQGGIAVVERAVCYDARGNGDGVIASTLTGDHENRITDYTSIVCEERTEEKPHTYTLRIRQGCEGGGKGALVQEDKSGTISTHNDQYLFVPTVYAVDQGGGKSQANVTEEMSPTLTCTHGGEPAVAYSFDPGASRDVGEFFIKECNKPLTNGTCPGHHDGVVIAFDRAAYNQGENARYDFEVTESGVNSTIVAKGPSGVCYAIGNGQADNTGLHDIPGALNCMHDQQAVCYGIDAWNGTETPESIGSLQASAEHNINSNNTVRTQYIVRRLTPTECARLQGFPDKWGHPDHKDDMTAEEYGFWREVRMTYDRINGRKEKAFTDAQILKWYNSLHNDGAEYKMWGNGIALPCALYIMKGIAEVLKNDRRTDY